MLKVIALGNALRGDDGVAYEVLDQLKQHSDVHQVQLLDIGSDAFTLLEHLMQSDPLLIIDCARMGKKPGDVVQFNIEAANLNQADQMVSLHGFSLAETYKMAAKMGRVAACKIIGIEPGHIEFNQRLSPEVKNSVPRVINMVKEEIKRHET